VGEVDTSRYRVAKSGGGVLLSYIFNHKTLSFKIYALQKGLLIVKNRKFYGVISMITSSLLICPGYASERGRKSLPQSEQDVIKEVEEGHEGASRRVKKRAEARDLQKKGEAFGKDVKTVTKPLSKVGTVAGFAASASGDPQAKMAAAALKVSIVAVEQLGVGISKIIMGVGRYQERSQEVLSNAEILLEEIQKSLDKKESLEKKISGLLKADKTLGPSEMCNDYFYCRFANNMFADKGANECA